MVFLLYDMFFDVIITFVVPSYYPFGNTRRIFYLFDNIDLSYPPRTPFEILGGIYITHLLIFITPILKY